MTTLPVLITARHVRLSQAHADVLFGAGAAFVDVCELPPTKTFATDRVVDVRGPAGTLKHVRVVGPLARATSVHVGTKDAATLGLEAVQGCTLEGPRGTVVLAGGVVVGLRRVVASPALGLVDGARTPVLVRGERERELRDVPVALRELGGARGWVEVDVEDANALEIGPESVAVVPE